MYPVSLGRQDRGSTGKTPTSVAAAGAGSVGYGAAPVESFASIQFFCTTSP